MPVPSDRWKVITPSRFPHEQEGLDHLRATLGEEVYHAWCNFEIADRWGRLLEIDLMLLTTVGLYLVELKAWDGVVRLGPGLWELQRHDSGYVDLRDSPLQDLNYKCKVLKELLEARRAVQATGLRLPFVQAAIYLSSPLVRLERGGDTASAVFERDGIQEAVRPGPGGLGLRKQPVERKLARAIIQAVEDAGIRPRAASRQVGDYRLERLLGEGPGYRDHLARHISLEYPRRVRTYLVAEAASAEERARVERAARREMTALEPIQHPGILKPYEFKLTDYGPALIFPWDPAARRLDEYVRLRDQQLDLSARLRLVRQLAEVLRYAHGRHLLHRSLSPYSVLVQEREGDEPVLLVMNWQTSQRGSETPGTMHVRELVEEPATVYLAPEAILDPEQADSYSDVFSLGACAWFVLTGRPPAASAVDLLALLNQERGLRLSSVMDGAPRALEDLVFRATHPEPAERLYDVEDFFALLEEAEKAAAAPEERTVENPLEAVPGDLLPGHLRVERILGRGSLSLALLVERDGSSMVLKTALDPAQNSRLQEEAEVLSTLEHRQIPRLLGETAFGPRKGLLLTSAGPETLAERLRESGPLQLDLLQRFGEDLLDVLAYLEKVGVAHRDVKPANLGILPLGENQVKRLTLFDFSLARTPADQIGAGTVPYLDPFLAERTPRRWDLQAERYAAGVTLYQMATGLLPQWGDGRSHPAVTTHETPVLESDRFDPSLREGMEQFFQRALHRRPSARFDNAVAMRQAWSALFAATETATGEGGGEEAALAGLLASATLETRLADLGLPARALRALDTLQALTVRDLVDLPGLRVRSMAGVGERTRREISEVRKQLRRRFPREAPAAEGETASLDALAADLTRKGRKAEGGLRRRVLGLEGDEPWAGQFELAAELGQEAGAVGRTLQQLGGEWARHAGLRGVRERLREFLMLQGGAAGVSEAAAMLLAALGAHEAEPSGRRRIATAVLRAAVEAESAKDARFLWARSGEAVVLALTPELSRYALALGETADALVAESEVVPPQRAVDALQRVEIPVDVPPGLLPLASARLIRLAAAAGLGTALSSRQELYLRGLPGERALSLAHGALLGEVRLTIEELSQRVASRYPDAGPLPERAGLEELLQREGWGFRWSEAEGAFVRTALLGPGSTSSHRARRFATTSGTRGALTPQALEARQFEERLEGALRTGGFLVLSVESAGRLSAEADLLRRFPLRRLSLEAELLDAMRAKAAENEVDWEQVQRTDADPSSTDWGYLLDLAAMALETVEERLLAQSDPLLLVNGGLLARYEGMGLLERLRDAAGRPGGPPAVWVLVAADMVQELPMLDGREIPLLTPTQRARIPWSWIQNEHRGRVA